MAERPNKILIVEDSPMMRQLYQMVLGGTGGAGLLFATNGVEGLDCAARETDIDLLIVDINMPQMDGLEFLRRLRTELGRDEVAAIVISTEGSDEDRQAARDVGATAYLQKPWHPDQLLQLVREVTGEAARDGGGS